MTTPIEKAAEARIRYETDGTCRLHIPCDLCDCGFDTTTPEQRAEGVRRAMDAERYVLTTALGSVEETARVLAAADGHTLWRPDRRCFTCTGYRNQAEALHAWLLAEPETKGAGRG